MKLWVGLGNPGARYAGNRHNIGFMAVDRIAADHGFGPWRARFQGSMAEGRLGEEKVMLLRPETFMNLSGQSVRAAVDFLKLAVADVTVFHDEIDLAPGKLRLKQGGGHAGHNGLRSISAHLGEGYARVRLGVGHPGDKDAVPGYVLHDFAKADRDWLEGLLRGIAEGAAALAAGDGARFQNMVAQRTSPPRSGSGGERREARPASMNPVVTGPVRDARGAEPRAAVPGTAKGQDPAPPVAGNGGASDNAGTGSLAARGGAGAGDLAPNAAGPAVDKAMDARGPAKTEGAVSTGGASGGAPAHRSGPVIAPEPPPEARSALQRLADRFRR